jgi:hypothetical protein
MKVKVKAKGEEPTLQSDLTSASACSNQFVVKNHDG